MQVGTLDRGLIGAKYHVRLLVSGKYRLVEWERLSGDPNSSQPFGAVGDAFESVVHSSDDEYCITADWNGWGFQEMMESPEEDDDWATLSLEVQLSRPGGEFQIVRHRDWDQTLYPLEEGGVEHKDEGGFDPVGGPDEDAWGRAWYLNGNVGDCFRIDFRRSKDRLGRKKVTWTWLRNEPLPKDLAEDAMRPRFSVFGSWSGGARLRELKWTGDYHHFYVELGTDAEASFQLARGLDWDMLFHPDIADANPNLPHRVIGPSPGDGRSRGLNWKIGKKGIEDAGDVFEVRVYQESSLWPHDRAPFPTSLPPGTPASKAQQSLITRTVINRVEWSRVLSGTDLTEAEAVGLVLRPPKRY